MDENIEEEFRDRSELIDYYDNRFSRPQVNFLAELEEVTIDKNKIEDDVEKLYETESLDGFHTFWAGLSGIGASKILESIKELEAEKLEEIDLEQKEDKVWLVLYLYKWDWEDKIEVINALNSFGRKRTYNRKTVSGTRKYQNPEEHRDEIEEEIKSGLEKANDRRKLQVQLKDIDFINMERIIIRLDVEKKAGSYRQFKFRPDSSPPDGEFELTNTDYYPVKTRNLYLDYERDEFNHSFTKSGKELADYIIGAFYKEPEVSGDVEFADPTDKEDVSPNEFVDERIEKQKKKYEESNLEEDEKKRRIQVLENLEAAEQTAITLKNVNVDGNAELIEVEAEESIQDFVQKQGIEEEYEKWVEKSENREYELTLGDKTIEVSRNEVKINGNIADIEEKVITSLLRRKGVIV